VPIKVAAVEDNQLRFVGLKTILSDVRDLEVVCVASTDCHLLVDRDVILVSEATSNGVLRVIEKITMYKPNSRVIVIGSNRDDKAVLDIITGGAKGYIDESAKPSEFARAIRIVNQGLVWASRRVISSLIDRCSNSVRHKFLPQTLTEREHEVLEMLVAGMSNKEIAVPLGIEERTVKSHVGKLMRKLGAKNRINLSIHAITHSLVNASHTTVSSVR
jgi:DNA-binding NarL/FixJ family response regulator